ncbi:CCAAT/enhancer-binding protein zeta-like [Lingula anatina]|uniref:CCAAT/enhancer-binding protein zeta n=1 Tax=Lingula anatina TaxID=7574 RepID=A0A1S3HR38_LINAN|nr:CCAAT/enhancer-binding protein zeta-like [Lingula anatina]|eukprot:XP_013388500.1 CCAAT/enhancer-binding protein zeta-like [Lingula anatina]
MGKKSRSTVEKPSVDKKDGFQLQDILDLGGDKDDLELLQDVDDDEDEEEALDGNEHDYESEPVRRDEVKALIEELGLKKYRFRSEEDGNDKKEKKKKLLVMPGFEEQKDEGKPPPDTQKKTKNKFKVQVAEVSSTTLSQSDDTEVKDYINSYTQRKYLLVKPGGKWYDNQFENDPVEFEAASKETIKCLEEFASRILQDEVTMYNKQKDVRKGSDAKWMKTVVSSGTLADKMAALTIQIQDSPVHTLQSLDLLINMAKKKGKRECMLAVDTLRELFISDLLPDRKLKPFEQHPLSQLASLTSGNKDARDKRLVMWYFEAQLKSRYETVVKALEHIGHDTIPVTKKKALSTVFELLVNKPEQEKALLCLLVNKLGDPDYKIAAKGAHLLSRLVDRHPNMKTVIVLEVERLLYRPNISVKAQYYAICFLNQLRLNHDQAQLAGRLIGVYFSFFKAFVKKGEVDSKMLSALLTGVNRAYPFAKVDKTTIEEHVGTLYKIVHIVKFSTSIQALMLLYQVMDSSDSLSDRYYSALYRKMVDPELKTSSKQTLFLNLLFKSMKKDVSDKRVKAFVKRLLQVCLYQTPPFICAALIILSEILKLKPQALQLSHMAEELDEDEEEHFQDVREEGDEGQETSDKTNEEPSENSISKPVKSSWVHRQNLGVKQETVDYDPHHRNPLYCKADAASEVELKQLAQHYHPSVALFAQKVLQRELVSYPGDPLQDFTLIRFLDRFVFRNPKKKTTAEATGGMMNRKQRGYQPQGLKAVPVNSEKYLEKGEEGVPVDEKFFYRYFSEKASKKKEVDDEDSDAESVSDEEFDDFLDSYEKQFDMDQDVKFDFAGEFGKQTNKKKKKPDDEEDDDDDDMDEDIDDDLSDEEPDFGDDDFKDAFIDEDDFDGEDEENSELSEDEAAISKATDRKQNKRHSADDFISGKRSKRKKSEFDTSGLFAAAEEFAHLIDENASSKLDLISTEAMSNKDNAGVKQLKWEADRDRWVQGRDWRTKKRQQRGAKHRGQFAGNKPKKQQYKGKKKSKNKR